MASIKELYKVGLLSAKRIPKTGVTGVITAAYPETIRDKKEGEKTKLVLEVNEGEYRIALNLTQAKYLAKLWGDDSDDWIGKKVKVTKGKTHFGADEVDCLLIAPGK